MNAKTKTLEDWLFDHRVFLPLMAIGTLAIYASFDVVERFNQGLVQIAGVFCLLPGVAVLSTRLADDKQPNSKIIAAMFACMFLPVALAWLIRNT